MHRFFVDTAQIGEDSITICGDDAHHISRVLRLGEDDEIIISDKCGKDYYCALKSVSPDMSVAWILKTEISKAEAPIRITLYQGVPKGDKLDTVIQKCVELGAVKIVPVSMKRCVAVIKDKDKKIKRMQRIAYEASKQCGRAVVPTIGDVLNFKDAISDAGEFDLKLAAYEAENINSLKSVLTKNKDAKTIAIFIGPEGGFDKSEIDLAKQNGFDIITLGPRILRTETAPLACISAIMYELGDW